jgi:hypothetical protein
MNGRFNILSQCARYPRASAALVLAFAGGVGVAVFFTVIYLLLAVQADAASQLPILEVLCGALLAPLAVGGIATAVLRRFHCLWPGCHGLYCRWRLWQSRLC